jgi:hypothetical protein
MSRRFIHVVAFLRPNTIPVYVHYIWLIHSSIDGHLGCFCIVEDACCKRCFYEHEGTNPSETLLFILLGIVG